MNTTVKYKKTGLLTGMLCMSLLGIAQQFIVKDGIPDSEIARIQAKARMSYHKLPAFKEWYAKQNAATQRTNANHVLFNWPLLPSADYDDIPNYFVITNFVDMDPAAGDNNILDWQCGDRTYDTHNGADIGAWPFWWRSKENGYMKVVAAAPGIVVDVVSNLPDDECIIQNIPANQVAVLHADSSVSYYLHLKAASSKVFEGDYVLEKQQLALVASSGRSSGPHLHFMAHDKLGIYIEPWKNTGSPDCNTINTDTWWQNQRPYWEPQVNRISTHYNHPQLRGPDRTCDYEEIPRLRNEFSPNDSIFFYVWFRDIQTGDSYTLDVLQPDGTNWYSTSGTHNSSPRSATSGARARKLPANAQSGTWKVIVEYRSVIYRHYFTVNCINNYILNSQTGSYGRTASNYIETTAVAENGEQVRLQAANEVIFKPGFHAKVGATLKAKIRDCNYAE